VTRPPLLLALYGWASRGLGPVVDRVLARRAAARKEDPARLAERWGEGGGARPPGTLVWIHAASVGETVTVLPLVARLVADGRAVLLTTVTVSAARLAAERLPPGAFHRYVPVDLPEAVARFLDHWRPDLGLFVEQELWPNLLAAAKARDVPLALVNARLSPRSRARWGLAAGTARHLLSHFACVLAQSAGDAARLASLGAPNVSAPGNLKFDAPAPGVDAALLARLLDAVGARPVWAAASTQPGEEERVLAAHASLKATHPDALLLLAPRHPPRGDAVEAAVTAAGFACARRSRGAWPEAATGVFLLDTIGELGLLYRAAPFAFVGGSLVAHGGQNPIEPGKLGRAVLHGPHVHNFAEVYAALDASGGGICVRDVEALAETVRRLVADSAQAARLGATARETVESLGGGLERTLAALAPLLPEPRP
jgi:3-deoxy-D-manno-octulosonic-acid transferase